MFEHPRSTELHKIAGLHTCEPLLTDLHTSSSVSSIKNVLLSVSIEIQCSFIRVYVYEIPLFQSDV